MATEEFIDYNKKCINLVQEVKNFYNIDMQPCIY